MKGLLHIYEGDGKGKTTAALGLAVRMAGSGGRVLMGQFLKSGDSSELAALRRIPNIRIMENQNSFGFTFRMREEEKRKVKSYYLDFFNKLVKEAAAGDYALLVMDELLDAWNLDMADRREVLDFLKNRPDNLEVVLTGRNPDPALVSLADYHTRFEKVKHPFDTGLGARKGIEL